jgi:hypothetical protein
MTPADFAVVYDKFKAAVSRYDCGKFCSPERRLAGLLVDQHACRWWTRRSSSS